MLRHSIGTSCCIVVFAALNAIAAERIVLTPTNWDDVVPSGKEVDAIYGDIVLRNDQLVAVIANPVEGRKANMTVRNVEGAIIDLTRRSRMNDQLSAFYPTAAAYPLREIPDANNRSTLRAGTVTYQCRATHSDGKPEVTVKYTLSDGEPFILIESTFKNPHDSAISVDLLDSMRADRSFRFGTDEATGTFWAYDSWWQQAYGIIPSGRTIRGVDDSIKKLRPVLAYADGDETSVMIEPSESFTLARKLMPADHQLHLNTMTRRLADLAAHNCEITVTDLSGPIEAAYVSIYSDDTEYGSGTTDETGSIELALPEGSYRMRIRVAGRKDSSQTLNVTGPHTLTVQVPQPGYVNAEITDEQGGPIPCKVSFQGKDDTKDPYYGPDTFEYAVQNLRYSHNGLFRLPIAAGIYDVIISHGPEYDAVFTTIDVKQDEEFSLQATLKRSVDTSGWISSDFHSHSTPSGDNTSSQLGRVLNLLAEHIEFGPCTEHNRISTYSDHLRTLNSQHRMATCSGMELTGSPLPVNHQNAFPLIYKPRTQDGGGPPTDEDPVLQIERIALWDDNSDKLVQQNHPNLVQIFGDRDKNGKADEGFRGMLAFMDVVEVHPPESIFAGPKQEDAERSNTMFRWLQLLNLGYRIPGVVNTDAHYNYHGSGWLRNYLRSNTDDPAAVSTMEMVAAAEQGHVVMTNGPFLEVTASNGTSEAIPGEDLAVENHSVALRIRVQCANWLDINRVQVFVNGRARSDLNFTRAAHPEKFHTDSVKFDESVAIELPVDSHVIVAAAGEGLKLGPVYGPDRGEKMPIAVSNPIFVDVDGNGFESNGDLLDAPLLGK